MPRAHVHLCTNSNCGGDLADKATAYDEVDGEIASRPVWKCRCCGQETKRIVRKSAKARSIEAKLSAYVASSRN